MKARFTFASKRYPYSFIRVYIPLRMKIQVTNARSQWRSSAQGNFVAARKSHRRLWQAWILSIDAPSTLLTAMYLPFLFQKRRTADLNRRQGELLAWGGRGLALMMRNVSAPGRRDHRLAGLRGRRLHITIGSADSQIGRNGWSYLSVLELQRRPTRPSM